MEGEEIGLVLARASELRSRISHGIDRNENEKDEDRENEEDDEEESLFGICDAFESLEQQLASLQALQHQQRYERETILSQIDLSRRVLLSKLREYKGQNWEIINEASLFAGETFDSDDPYPLIIKKDQTTPPPPNRSNVSNESNGSKGMNWSKGVLSLVGVVIFGVILGMSKGMLIKKSGTDLDAGDVARCVAKRRVNAPFESGVKDPNITYGSG